VKGVGSTMRQIFRGLVAVRGGASDDSAAAAEAARRAEVGGGMEPRVGGGVTKHSTLYVRQAATKRIAALYFMLTNV